MNFTFTWIMDKLGYMPKIDMQIGKVNLDVAVPDLSKPRVRKTRALPSKATVAKTAARTARAKKAK
jgi:carbamoylphosphate synthase large subunit